ncbi:MAG: membrane protein insertase YidC [Alphaproteobacteria bacterium]
MNNDKDKMHPEDMRNLIIFALLSVCIWFLYDTFIGAPQKEAFERAKKAQVEMIKENPILAQPVKDVPRDEALTTTRRLAFENDHIKGSISMTGGLIDDLILKDYYKTLDKKEFVELFSPSASERSRYVDMGWVTREKGINLPNAKTTWQVRGNTVLAPEKSVTLVWDNGQGLEFNRKISLDEQFVFKITQSVFNKSGQSYDLHPYGLITQKGIPVDYMNMWIAHEGPMGFIGESLEQMDYGAMAKDPNKKLESENGWIGISDKYWLTALIPAQGEVTKYRFRYVPDATKNIRNRYQTDFTGEAMTLEAGGVIEHSYNIYAGAKKVIVLDEYQEKLGVNNLDYAVDFGWFWFFTKPFFFALHYLGLWVGNMGVAIIILTCIIRMSVYPFTSMSYRSFAKMKVVAPRLTELREQYGDNKEKLQAEIIQLYQKEGVNPMSGCFPMLIQIPIFFAFYKILLMTIEVRHAPFFGWIQDLSARDPTSVFNLFGALPYEVPSFMMIGVWPCLMLIAMLMQKKLNPPPQDKMQRDMMNIFPFFITFIMAGFASGLVLYWTFSAALSVLQQAYIMKSMGVPIYFFEKDKFKEALEKKVEEGPDVHPLIEMVEDETEKALFGEGEADAPKEINPPKPKKKTATKKKAAPKKTTTKKTSPKKKT